MSATAHRRAPEAGAPPQAPPSGRVVSIDILRGLAILWVIVFHLHWDLTDRFDPGGPYPQFRDEVLAGRPIAALTHFGDLIVGQGYLGVVVFMMLSGLSLTMNAYGRGEPGILRGYWTRLRRLVVVYWGGVLLILGAVAIVALLQMLKDGHSYEHQWFNVRIAGFIGANIMWDDVVWALSVVPWIFRDKLETVPVGSLWFVELLIQYYLLFPFALILLRKIGPWYFALAGLGLTLAARGLYVPWAYGAMLPLHAARNLGNLSLFRGAEFYLGMSLGYLLACRRDQLAAWVRSPFDTAGLLVLGALCVGGGVVVGPWSETWLIVSDVLMEVGLALLVVPLLFKAPGGLERSAPARALVYLGIVSLTALIINDMMRYFESFLQYEGLTAAKWWFLLWAVFVPVGTVLAYPLASLFGLLPHQRASARAAPAALVSKRKPERRVARDPRASARPVRRPRPS